MSREYINKESLCQNSLKCRNQWREVLHFSTGFSFMKRPHKSFSADAFQNRHLIPAAGTNL